MLSFLNNLSPSNLVFFYRNNKKVFQNFSYLYIIQILNLFLPLLTYPYLVRVLDKETFGLIIFIQALLLYFCTLISFGFNISATKLISENRGNLIRLSEIVSHVYFIKFIMFLISTFLFAILIHYFPVAQDNKILFILSFWMCINELLSPTWFFQGIEEMKYITLINLVSRCIFFFLVFIVIKDASDYLYIPIINGVGALIGAFLSIYIIIFNKGVKITKLKLNLLCHYFKMAIPLSLSDIIIKIYESGNRVIIGVLLNPTSVLHYDLAEKIIAICKTPFGMFSQAIFPKVSRDKDLVFVNIVLVYYIFLSIVLVGVLNFFGPNIIYILGGESMSDSIMILRVLSFTIPVIVVGNIFGHQKLVVFGHDKEFTSILAFSAFLYLVFVICMWNFELVSLVSFGIIVLLIEVFVTSTFYLFLKKRKLG